MTSICQVCGYRIESLDDRWYAIERLNSSNMLLLCHEQPHQPAVIPHLARQLLSVLYP